jgi:hypothetical protein
VRSAEIGQDVGVDLLAPANYFLLLVNLVLLGLAIWAFVDAAVRPAAAFPAAGKLTKPIWLGITGVCVALSLLGVGLLGLLGGVVAVAVIVYLVDVRPAVREMRPGGPWR